MLGAQWLRVNALWNSIEDATGRRDWTVFDSIIKAAQENDIRLVLQIRGFSDFPAGDSDYRRRLAKYEDFVGEFAQRYHYAVKHWQIENEISSRHFWRGTVAEYLDVLSRAYSVIKAVDSSATVLLPGFPLGTLDVTDQNALERAPNQQLIADIDTVLNRGRNHFDILDIHLYYSARSIPQRIEFFRSRMRMLGLDKPIWVTEVAGPDPRYTGHPATPAEQRVEVIKRYCLALSSGAERVFWHNLQASASRRHPIWTDMALLLDWKPTSVYNAYKLMTRKLDGFSEVQPVDVGLQISAFRFEKSNGPVYVIWSEEPRHFDLPEFRDSVRVTDMVGVEMLVATDDLIVHQQPVYVEALR